MHIRMTSMARLIFVVSVLFHSASAFAQVSRDQLIGLANDGVDTSLIVSLIERDCVDFEPDAEVILELSQVVPREALKAAIECWRSGKSVENSGDEPSEDSRGNGAIKVKGEESEAEVHYKSPMEIDLPLEWSVTGNELTEQWSFQHMVCDNVTIEMLKLEVRHLTRREPEVRFYVTTHTRRGKDRMADVSVQMFSGNDSEKRTLRFRSFGSRVTTKEMSLEINAEERKYRKEKAVFRIDGERFREVLSGANPTLRVTLKVEIN